MKWTFRVVAVGTALIVPAFGQTTGAKARTEFEAASIRVNPPRTGFHFASDNGSGGPGTSDPGMYRCPDCTLATLVGKAFDLRTHQFPAGSSLGDKTFEVTARIPAGAIPEEFQAMLQNLLKERFGLAYHFQEKKMRGFHLVLARDGSKLKESGNSAGPSNARTETHRFGQGENHTHTGVINFGGMARYHGDRVTAAGLARILSDQLGLPVDDQTGLTGTYEVSLTWNGNTTRSDGIHGFAGHADHGGVAADSGAASGDSSGPTLFEAVQTQLGLKLVAADQTTARIFVVDHVDHVPTGN